MKYFFQHVYVVEKARLQLIQEGQGKVGVVKKDERGGKVDSEV